MGPLVMYYIWRQLLVCMNISVSNILLLSKNCKAFIYSTTPWLQNKSLSSCSLVIQVYCTIFKENSCIKMSISKILLSSKTSIYSTTRWLQKQQQHASKDGYIEEK